MPNMGNLKLPDSVYFELIIEICEQLLFCLDNLILSGVSPEINMKKSNVKPWYFVMSHLFFQSKGSKPGESVKVVVRCRPMNEKEIAGGYDRSVKVFHFRTEFSGKAFF